MSFIEYRRTTGLPCGQVELPELLERLLTTPGPSGQERAAARVAHAVKPANIIDRASALVTHMGYLPIMNRLLAAVSVPVALTIASYSARASASLPWFCRAQPSP